MTEQPEVFFSWKRIGKNWLPVMLVFAVLAWALNLSGGAFAFGALFVLMFLIFHELVLRPLKPRDDEP